MDFLKSALHSHTIVNPRVSFMIRMVIFIMDFLPTSYLERDDFIAYILESRHRELEEFIGFGMRYKLGCIFSIPSELCNFLDIVSDKIYAIKLDHGSLDRLTLKGRFSSLNDSLSISINIQDGFRHIIAHALWYIIHSDKDTTKYTRAKNWYRKVLDLEEYLNRKVSLVEQIESSIMMESAEQDGAEQDGEFPLQLLTAFSEFKLGNCVRFRELFGKFLYKHPDLTMKKKDERDVPDKANPDYNGRLLNIIDESIEQTRPGTIYVVFLNQNVEEFNLDGSYLIEYDYLDDKFRSRIHGGPDPFIQYCNIPESKNIAAYHSIGQQLIIRCTEIPDVLIIDHTFSLETLTTTPSINPKQLQLGFVKEGNFCYEDPQLSHAERSLIKEVNALLCIHPGFSPHLLKEYKLQRDNFKARGSFKIVIIDDSAKDVVMDKVPSHIYKLDDMEIVYGFLNGTSAEYEDGTHTEVTEENKDSVYNSFEDRQKLLNSIPSLSLIVAYDNLYRAVVYCENYVKNPEPRGREVYNGCLKKIFEYLTGNNLLCVRKDELGHDEHLTENSCQYNEADVDMGAVLQNVRSLRIAFDDILVDYINGWEWYYKEGGHDGNIWFDIDPRESPFYMKCRFTAGLNVINHVEWNYIIKGLSVFDSDCHGLRIFYDPVKHSIFIEVQQFKGP